MDQYSRCTLVVKCRNVQVRVTHQLHECILFSSWGLHPSVVVGVHKELLKHLPFFLTNHTHLHQHHHCCLQLRGLTAYEEG